MRGAKVLVVDDSTSVRKVLEKLLSSRGLVVTTCETAEQGLEAVKQNTPNLVIADVVMPGMSGFELCQMVKTQASTKNIPVILISGIINEDVVSQAHQAGAFDVVSKPFTPDDLFPKIERALNTIWSSPQAVGLTSEASTPPLPTTPSDVSTQVVSETHSSPNRQVLLEGLLPFIEKPEVEAVLVIDNAGQLLDWRGQTLNEPDLLATYIRTLLSISNVLGEKYHLSSIQSLSLEYHGKTLIINRIDHRASLVLILRGTGGTGVIRYLVLRQIPQLKAALGD
jgi:CheY-like chemotaxis protein/predicted regulator of Ras-like GTPase activity (Roadblock/LC7/MglB family)